MLNPSSCFLWDVEGLHLSSMDILFAAFSSASNCSTSFSSAPCSQPCSWVLPPCSSNLALHCAGKKKRSCFLECLLACLGLQLLESCLQQPSPTPHMSLLHMRPSPAFGRVSRGLPPYQMGHESPGILLVFHKPVHLGAWPSQSGLGWKGPLQAIWSHSLQ